MQLELPENWEELWIIGFDEADDDSEDDDSDDDAGDDDDDDGDDDGEDQGEGQNKTYTQADMDAQKTVNTKERKLRRQAERDKRRVERELAELKARAESGDDKAQADQVKQALDAEKSKGSKLATRLRDAAVENAIIKVANSKDFKFRDIDDVLQLVNRGDIDVDQDDEDPADIDVDLDTVISAVKKLSEKKPHLLVAEGDGEPSGRRFGGKNKKTQDTDEDVLRSRYPALARGTKSGS
jgi:hypothetical protein